MFFCFQFQQFCRFFSCSHLSHLWYNPSRTYLMCGSWSLSGALSLFNKLSLQFISKTKKLSSKKDVCNTNHYLLIARFEKFSKNVAYLNSILKYILNRQKLNRTRCKILLLIDTHPACRFYFLYSSSKLILHSQLQKYAPSIKQNFKHYQVPKMKYILSLNKDLKHNFQIMPAWWFITYPTVSLLIVKIKSIIFLSVWHVDSSCQNNSTFS